MNVKKVIFLNKKKDAAISKYINIYMMTYFVERYIKKI